MYILFSNTKYSNSKRDMIKLWGEEFIQSNLCQEISVINLISLHYLKTNNCWNFSHVFLDYLKSFAGS